MPASPMHKDSSAMKLTFDGRVDRLCAAGVFSTVYLHRARQETASFLRPPDSHASKDILAISPLALYPVKPNSSPQSSFCRSGIYAGGLLFPHPSPSPPLQPTPNTSSKSNWSLSEKLASPPRPPQQQQQQQQPYPMVPPWVPRVGSRPRCSSPHSASGSLLLRPTGRETRPLPHSHSRGPFCRNPSQERLPYGQVYREPARDHRHSRDHRDNGNFRQRNEDDYERGMLYRERGNGYRLRGRDCQYDPEARFRRGQRDFYAQIRQDKDRDSYNEASSQFGSGTGKIRPISPSTHPAPHPASSSSSSMTSRSLQHSKSSSNSSSVSSLLSSPTSTKQSYTKRVSSHSSSHAVSSANAAVPQSHLPPHPLSSSSSSSSTSSASSSTTAAAAAAAVVVKVENSEKNHCRQPPEETGPPWPSSMHDSYGRGNQEDDQLIQVNSAIMVKFRSKEAVLSKPSPPLPLPTSSLSPQKPICSAPSVSSNNTKKDSISDSLESLPLNLNLLCCKKSPTNFPPRTRTVSAQNNQQLKLITLSGTGAGSSTVRMSISTGCTPSPSPYVQDIATAPVLPPTPSATSATSTKLVTLAAASSSVKPTSIQDSLKLKSSLQHQTSNPTRGVTIELKKSDLPPRPNFEHRGNKKTPPLPYVLEQSGGSKSSRASGAEELSAGSSLLRRTVGSVRANGVVSSLRATSASPTPMSGSTISRTEAMRICDVFSRTFCAALSGDPSGAFVRLALPHDFSWKQDVVDYHQKSAFGESGSCATQVRQAALPQSGGPSICESDIVDSSSENDNNGEDMMPGRKRHRKRKIFGAQGADSNRTADAVVVVGGADDDSDDADDDVNENGDRGGSVVVLVPQPSSQLLSSLLLKSSANSSSATATAGTNNVTSATTTINTNTTTTANTGPGRRPKRPLESDLSPCAAAVPIKRRKSQLDLDCDAVNHATTSEDGELNLRRTGGYQNFLFDENQVFDCDKVKNKVEEKNDINEEKNDDDDDEDNEDGEEEGDGEGKDDADQFCTRDQEIRGYYFDGGWGDDKTWQSHFKRLNVSIDEATSQYGDLLVKMSRHRGPAPLEMRRQLAGILVGVLGIMVDELLGCLERLPGDLPRPLDDGYDGGGCGGDENLAGDCGACGAEQSFGHKTQELERRVGRLARQQQLLFVDSLVTLCKQSLHLCAAPSAAAGLSAEGLLPPLLAGLRRAASIIWPSLLMYLYALKGATVVILLRSPRKIRKKIPGGSSGSNIIIGNRSGSKITKLEKKQKLKLKTNVNGAWGCTLDGVNYNSMEFTLVEQLVTSYHEMRVCRAELLAQANEHYSNRDYEYSAHEGNHDLSLQRSTSGAANNSDPSQNIGSGVGVGVGCALQYSHPFAVPRATPFSGPLPSVLTLCPPPHPLPPLPPTTASSSSSSSWSSSSSSSLMPTSSVSTVAAGGAVFHELSLTPTSCYTPISGTTAGSMNLLGVVPSERLLHRNVMHLVSANVFDDAFAARLTQVLRCAQGLCAKLLV